MKDHHPAEAPVALSVRCDNCGDVMHLSVDQSAEVAALRAELSDQKAAAAQHFMQAMSNGRAALQAEATIARVRALADRKSEQVVLAEGATSPYARGAASAIEIFCNELRAALEG